MASARELARHDIEKAKEEDDVLVATVLKRQYAIKIGWLGGLSMTINPKMRRSLIWQSSFLKKGLL